MSGTDGMNEFEKQHAEHNCSACESTHNCGTLMFRFWKRYLDEHAEEILSTPLSDDPEEDAQLKRLLETTLGYSVISIMATIAQSLNRSGMPYQIAMMLATGMRDDFQDACVSLVTLMHFFYLVALGKMSMPVYDSLAEAKTFDNNKRH